MSTTQPIRNSEKLEIFKDYYKKIKPNKRNYALIITGLNTALRISDLLNLRYSDIYDFKHSKFHSHICITEKKTGKRNQIYINRHSKEALENLMNFEKKDESSWIFESQRQKEKPLSRIQAYRIVREAADYAGLDRCISCHSLRKTFGYHAWKLGSQPAVLMNIYNHSTFQITKRYLGIEQDDRDEVFMNIDI